MPRCIQYTRAACTSLQLWSLLIVAQAMWTGLRCSRKTLTQEEGFLRSYQHVCEEKLGIIRDSRRCHLTSPAWDPPFEATRVNSKEYTHHARQSLICRRRDVTVATDGRLATGRCCRRVFSRGPGCISMCSLVNAGGSLSI